MGFCKYNGFYPFLQILEPKFWRQGIPSGGARGGGAVRRAPGALPQGGSLEGKPFVVVEGDYVLAAHH